MFFLNMLGSDTDATGNSRAVYHILSKLQTDCILTQTKVYQLKIKGC